MRDRLQISCTSRLWIPVSEQLSNKLAFPLLHSLFIQLKKPLELQVEQNIEIKLYEPFFRL